MPGSTTSNRFLIAPITVGGHNASDDMANYLSIELREIKRNSKLS